MKRIFKTQYWFVLLAIMSFTACQDDTAEEIFDQSPSVRADQQINELKALLLSETNGYRAEYFTKNDERGGFTIYMQFNADGTVRQTSDFNDQTALANSLYEVRFGTTVELVFLTRNHITKAVDPTAAIDGVAVEVGTGYAGTNNFQFFSNDAGVLSFRDIRNSETATLTLTPTKFADFDSQSLAEVDVLRDNYTKLSSPQTDLPTYPVLEFNNSQGNTRFKFAFNKVTRFSTSRLVTANAITDLEFGIAPTLNGLTVSPPLTYQEESFEDFIYDDETDRYVATVNGATAAIYYDFAAAYVNPNDIIELEEDLGPSGFLYRLNLGANALTSNTHDAMINLVSDTFNQGLNLNYRISEYQLVLDFSNNDCATFLVVQLYNDVNDNGVNDGEAVGPNIFYCFEAAKINDGKLFLTYTGIDNPGLAFTVPWVQPLLDFIGDPDGLVFSREGSFSTDRANFSNAAGTFTSVDSEGNGEIRVYGLFF